MIVKSVYLYLVPAQIAKKKKVEAWNADFFFFFCIMGAPSANAERKLRLPTSPAVHWGPERPAAPLVHNCMRIYLHRDRGIKIQARVKIEKYGMESTRSMAYMVWEI